MLEVLNVLVLCSFLSRLVDRLYSLLADQGRRYQKFPAPRAERLAHPEGTHLPDRDRPALDTSHPAALALPPALAGGPFGPSGLELLLPSAAFCSPSGRGGTLAATGATP